MSEQTVKKEIVEPLLTWYNAVKRNLPWRDKDNAYYTWVSEIMLQQTRVEAVKPYFDRFISRLPDIQSLATCPEEELMKLWEGLGYYSRVRNMQKAAIQIVEQYDGQLPKDFEKLLSLKGIGRYTAGAIASIAYRIPVPAVDGNVLRVVTRLTENPQDIMKQAVRREIEKQLSAIIPVSVPGDFNQALMELGAVVCVPSGSPKCNICPVKEFCHAYINGHQEAYPVKAKKKPRSIEERTVLVIQDGCSTALRKRPGEGLLAGLYEFPNILGYYSRTQALSYVRDLGLDPLYIRELPDSKHIFSHIEWRMKAYQIKVASLDGELTQDFFFAGREETQQHYAIPSAFGAYLKYMREA